MSGSYRDVRMLDGVTLALTRQRTLLRRTRAGAELGMCSPHCHLGLGKLYRRTGQREKAQEHPATAAMMYREMEMGFWLEKAEAEMKEA